MFSDMFIADRAVQFNIDLIAIRSGSCRTPIGLSKRINYILLFIQVYILKKEEGGRHKPFVTNYTPQMYVRTGDVAATITLPEDKQFVMPGENANLNFELMWDMPLEIGLRFTLREGSKTVGTGVVTKLGD